MCTLDLQLISLARLQLPRRTRYFPSSYGTTTVFTFNWTTPKKWRNGSHGWHHAPKAGGTMTTSTVLPLCSECIWLCQPCTGTSNQLFRGYCCEMARVQSGWDLSQQVKRSTGIMQTQRSAIAKQQQHQRQQCSSPLKSRHLCLHDLPLILPQVWKKEKYIYGSALLDHAPCFSLLFYSFPETQEKVRWTGVESRRREGSTRCSQESEAKSERVCVSERANQIEENHPELELDRIGPLTTSWRISNWRTTTKADVNWSQMGGS